MMASYNWNQYLNKVPTPGQLLPYPLNVMPDGKLEYLDGVESFPDFPLNAKIKGKTNLAIPQKVTTWRIQTIQTYQAQSFYKNHFVKVS